METDIENRFGGIIRLYGKEAFLKLSNSSILIVGLGGVGSWAVEALARTGINHLILVDLDEVCITNTNRQICADDSQIGKMKGDVLKKRIQLINPNCRVDFIPAFFTESNIDLIFDRKIDFVIDAIDSLDNKCLLLTTCQKKNIPIVVTGGAAGKKDSTLIQIQDLGLTINDVLLQRMRKKLRREYGMKKAVESRKATLKRLGIPCIYSPEFPVYPSSTGEVCLKPETDEDTYLDCETGMGSVAHLTGMMGFLSAQYVINQITQAIIIARR